MNMAHIKGIQSPWLTSACANRWERFARKVWCPRDGCALFVPISDPQGNPKTSPMKSTEETRPWKNIWLIQGSLDDMVRRTWALGEHVNTAQSLTSTEAHGVMMKMVWVLGGRGKPRDFARRGPGIASVCSSRAAVSGTLHLVLVFTLKARAGRGEWLESLS